MSEMIERVARIMCSVDNGWNKNCDDRWTHYVPMARAAIEEMRDPTKAMLTTIATEDWCGNKDLEWSDGWKIMIDAALND